MNSNPQKQVWYPTPEAAEMLGISAYTLRNRMRPYLKMGANGHYKAKNPTAKQKRYLWHVPRLLKFQGEGGDRDAS